VCFLLVLHLLPGFAVALDFGRALQNPTPHTLKWCHLPLAKSGNKEVTLTRHLRGGALLDALKNHV
jgi:hypothetical protein